jgi:hypothetical protein
MLLHFLFAVKTFVLFIAKKNRRRNSVGSAKREHRVLSAKEMGTGCVEAVIYAARP